MVRRHLILILIVLATAPLCGCLTTSTVTQRPGVDEAKACLHGLRANPGPLEGFIIQACTNDGVWMVDQLDPTGTTVAQYDFVNGDYAGPETGFGFVPVDSLGEETIQAYQSLHKTLNQNLKQTL